MNDDNIRQAQTVFEICKSALDDSEWNYDHNDEEMWITCTYTGEDLPIDLYIKVNAKRQMIIISSRIPVIFPEDKIIDAALACSMINSSIVDGSFDLNVKTGKVYYRMTGCFLESLISKGFFDYMMVNSLRVVEEFNDKLFTLAKGITDLKQSAKLFSDDSE